MTGDLPLKAADAGTELSQKDFADTKVLEASRNAVVDAAGVGGGLWLSYIFVLFYLFIAAAGVTHRDLLFESPVKLPFFNVDLPLTGFFSLGPGLLLIVHAYVLLHLVLLAEKVGSFNAELEAQISEDDAKARWRRQLPSNLFVQFLAGPKEVRTGVIGFMLRFIGQISLIVSPLFLLVFFQLQFLPYHNEWLTCGQRIAVLLDLMLLWGLWPSIALGEMTRLRWWRELRRVKVAGLALASFALLLLVFTVATFPGERLDKNLWSARIIPTEWPPWKSQNALPSWTRWTSLHQLLFAGPVDFGTGKRMSLWSNTLVLPNIDVIDHEKFDTEAKIAALPHTLSLRGRQLEGAVFILADLRKVDFTAARLRDANLAGADLRNTKFECSGAAECADLRGVVLSFAKLQGASLDGAQLTRALLTGTQMEGASLRKAQLQGAWLRGAQLQGASLDEALLWGAQLDNPQLWQPDAPQPWLQTASLYGAQLQGASLDGAQLQGASLNFAQLQGASLDKAQLQGASLVNTQLQGASLVGTQLQGALLIGTQFQGASLVGAQLQGASLIRIFAWRADARDSKGEGALVLEPENYPKYHMLGCAFEPWGCDWSSGAFAELKRLIERQVPEGDRRAKALHLIAILDPARPSPDKQEEEKVWTDLARSSPSLDIYTKGLAARLQEMGCDATLGPYMISAFLLNPISARFLKGSPQWNALAAAFLDEAHCPAAHALMDADRVSLQVIRKIYGSAPSSTASHPSLSPSPAHP